MKETITLDVTLKRVDDDLLSSSMADETVMMNVMTGDYIGLNEVASSIWSLLEHAITVNDICSRLTEIFDIEKGECQKKTLSFLNKLYEEKMLQIV